MPCTDGADIGRRRALDRAMDEAVRKQGTSRRRKKDGIVRIHLITNHYTVN